MVNSGEQPRLFGIFEKLNEEICRRVQRRCTLEYFPPARAAAMVESGLADGENYRILDFQKDGKNPRHLRVNAVLYTTSFVVWGRSASSSVRSWEDLVSTNGKILYLFGSKMVPIRTAGIESGKLMATYSVDSGIRMLAYDRAVYFVATDSSTVCRTIDSLNLVGAITHRGELEKVDTFMYLNDRHLALATRMREAIQGMRRDGTYSEILREPGPPTAACDPSASKNFQNESHFSTRIIALRGGLASTSWSYEGQILLTTG